MPRGPAAGGRTVALPNQTLQAHEPRRDWVSEFGARLRAARGPREGDVYARPDTPLERGRPAVRPIDLERRAQFGRCGFGAH